jgi:pimeloyl-ACP methyl ester carboxylesterase
MGLGADHTAWSFQVPDLVAAGYQCIAFDNRDVGQTADSPVPAYTIRDMAEDTVGLMDALGLDSAHVVGDSMGGMIAQELAIAHPDRLRTLTLVCTEPHVDPYLGLICESWRSMRSRLEKKDFARAASVWVMSHRYLAEEKNVREFVDLMFDNPHPQSDAGFFRQLDACLGHDTLGRLERIQAPTLVLVGEEDILTPPRLSRLMVERIPGAKLVVIPEGPHGFIWEQAPEVNRVILDFLGEHRLEPVGATAGRVFEKGGVR